MNSSILIVDDDPSHRQMIEAVLTAEGYETNQVEDGLTAVARVEGRFFDLILMDIRMNRMGGIEALREIKKISPGIPIIMMTAYASVGTAVEALKSGAYDYLTKPIDIEELKILVKKALHHSGLERENLALKERLGDRFDFGNIVGSSPAMLRMFETLALVAPTDATVLILGESGTGKELVANAIHQNSPRKDRPFVKVNCAALPETLLESELFGHEKGSFTGALSSKPGRFRQAHRGSIFLDEIAEMSAATQAKILRVLQEREIQPVGGAGTIQVDTRVIAATNRDLRREIENGRFREDLFYRLDVVTLTIPPLRDRREDISLLAELFLKQYAEKNRKLVKGFSPKAIDVLMRHAWPGNIRELENVVERSVILARGETITPGDFPAFLKAPGDELGEGDPLPIGKTLKDMERSMILRTLEEAEGNRSQAARILGISRRTLQLKLKEYALGEGDE
jgi:two-component system, NtrC family, response regulator HydG